MRLLKSFFRDRSANAAAELALVLPMMLVLLFGSLELGNLFLDEHALSKQVRDGARFAARLELASDYDCTDDPATVFADGAEADDKIINVTQTGAVEGAGNPRWVGYWDRSCGGDGGTISVAIRCVPKSSIDPAATGNTGIYSGLDGDIPVVKVSGAVKYRSILGAIGFDATNICLRSESEAAVTGV